VTMVAREQVFAAVLVAAVVGAVAAGLAVVGSPAKARLRRLDERRIEDLRDISQATDRHYLRYGRLPPSLDSLTPEIGAPSSIRDPAGAEPYVYRVLSDSTYELCARFALGSSTSEGRFGPDLWAHRAGQQCFQLQGRRPGR